MTLSRTTRDHDEIRKWAESRGAVPAEVAGTERGGETGILRFEFPKAPNHNDSKLQQVSWDDFFEKFDENDLELVYQEKTADGQKSNFNKLVHPSNEEHSSRSKSHSGSSGNSRSNKSSSGDENESGGGSRGSRSSHSSSSSSGATHSASASKGNATRESDIDDEDIGDEDDEELGDDFEEVAEADDLDDNGDPRRSGEGSSSRAGKSSGKSGGASHSSSSHSSGTKSSGSKPGDSNSKSSSSKKN